MTLTRSMQLWAFGLCMLTVLCLCGFLTRPVEVRTGSRRLGTTRATGASAAASGSNLTKAGRVAGDSAAQCGLVEEDVDYWGGDLRAHFSVESAAKCAEVCATELACKSYTFVVARGSCYLKREVRPGRTRNTCCVSGLPSCPSGQHSWPTPLPRPKIYTSPPIRGVAYAPLPCLSGCWVSEDMLQEGYSALWGAAPAGRDDLAVIKDLGANTVRLYHSIGLGGRGFHGHFLDRAQALGLDVMPGYHTYNAIYGGCPHFDCYDAWKSYTLKAFDSGFKVEGGWHPAVSVLLLFNELDFFRGYGRTAHLKSALSALDGVLAAEQEAGVQAGRVRLSIAWSNSHGESLDGKVKGFAVWAFQDIVAGVADPSIVGYTPRMSQALIQEAFARRWAHGINVQTPGITGYMAEHYSRFEPIPWFIGEYGANGLPRDLIKAELESMDKLARDEADPFMGAAFFQFQTAYFKGGSEMNFGLFRLGEREVGQTGEICDKGNSCKRMPVHCLTTDTGGLPEFVHERPNALAAAWGGAINTSRLC